ncbi:MAG: DUF4272 domain-containing protein [Legionella sp.]|nr:DUF4272 domain-containing protein [Legionella sp.]
MEHMDFNKASKILLDEVSNLQPQIAKIEQCLVDGADINYQAENDGYTALMLAVDNDDEASVLFLLQHGADPLILNHYNEIARDLALNHSPIHKILTNYKTYVRKHMPHANDPIDPLEVKRESEKIILNAGGEILDWLPTIENPAKPRTLDDVIKRALVLNAMYQLHMKAPKYYIAQWLEENELTSELTPKEHAILYSPNELTEEEHYALYCSVDALWALVWATNLINDLSFNQPVGDELAGLSPNLQVEADGTKYESTMQLRSIKAIYQTLDLYYRAHWWVLNATREGQPTGDAALYAVIERRRALEWLLNSDSAWDTVDLST